MNVMLNVWVSYHINFNFDFLRLESVVILFVSEDHFRESPSLPSS